MIIFASVAIGMSVAETTVAETLMAETTTAEATVVGMEVVGTMAVGTADAAAGVAKILRTETRAAPWVPITTAKSEGR